MTLYTTLALQLERAKYTKGAYKGAAPADPARRWKDYFRVERRSSTTVAVVFHYTDIITADATGTVTLRSSGYDTSPTTRAAFAQFGFRMRSHRLGVTSNTAVSWHRRGHPAGPTYVFFEGMTLTPDGTLDPSQTPALASKVVADRDERKAFREDPDVQAFREMLPVLVEGQRHMEPIARRQLRYSGHYSRLDELAFARHENWPAIVAGVPNEHLHSAAAAWAWVYAVAAKTMTKTIEVPL